MIAFFNFSHLERAITSRYGEQKIILILLYQFLTQSITLTYTLTDFSTNDYFLLKKGFYKTVAKANTLTQRTTLRKQLVDI